MSAHDEREFWNYAATTDTVEDDFIFDPTLNGEQVLLEMVEGLGQPKSILEIGCGTGRLTRQLAELFPDADITGVDISLEMVRRARHKDLGHTFRYLLGDGRSLPFVNNSMDAVVSFACFQHIPMEGVQAYLHEIARVLTPSGRFRIQFVAFGEDGPMSFAHEPDRMRYAVQRAWLRVTEENNGKILPQWDWLTGTHLGKP